MARPLRIEFPGILYHVPSGGDRLCHGYCLMTNHYPLLIETPDGNLSRDMRQLNGVFTQVSNRRQRRSGHLFQGRFKGILVVKDSCLLQLTRHVVVNTVQVGMVHEPAEWP
jgi:putative transposase